MCWRVHLSAMLSCDAYCGPCDFPDVSQIPDLVGVVKLQLLLRL